MALKRDETAPVVISPEDDARRERQMDRFLATIERIGERNADKDPDEVLREVTAIVEEARQEQYERAWREAGERC